MKKTALHETLDCGCRIESPAYKNLWHVVERGETCRFHIVGERLNIPSGRFRLIPEES